jgi:hypothetical protein
MPPGKLTVMKSQGNPAFAWTCAWLAWCTGLTPVTAEVNHAIRVVDYLPGQPLTAWTNTTAALGQPSQVTHDPHPEWGGSFPVTPFSSPYLPDQILALGPGGQLTLELDRPVFDHPANPFGLDLIVFGNSFFQYHADWTTTTGSLGGTNTGHTTVSVSRDGHAFYRLNAPANTRVDTWFPTDGAGDFSKPVSPTLGAADFAGRDLEGIRELYAGSGGGTGFDLAWAVDQHGSPVTLPWIRFVRFVQEHGQTQIDAVSGIGRRAAWFEDFTQPPHDVNWNLHGEPELFHWNPTTQLLEVTWNSAHPNSFFHRPLGTVLDPRDDFTIAFDLRLDSVEPGTTPGKPFAFQIAVGLVHLDSALRPEFFRGAGLDPQHGPRNLFEFNYFPDTGFGATVMPVMVSSNNQWAWSYLAPAEWPLGQWIHVVMHYTAAHSTIHTTLTIDTQPWVEVPNVVLPADFTDLHLDAVAVCSYNDGGQDPQFAGSVLAHGALDNLTVVVPPPPVHRVRTLPHATTPGTWTVEVEGRAGWIYELQRTIDWTTWNTVASSPLIITPGSIQLTDPQPTAGHGFYQVHARKPELPSDP